MQYADILGIEPTAVVQPVTQDEIAAVIRDADASGKSVIPWGGGTAQDYGYPPRRADILLDLSQFRRVLAHEPGDLTVTVEAGATLADVQAVLARENQFLPLDPPHADRATMGGIIAMDACGPSRVGYGRVRDWLIGLTVVDPQGRVVKGGGKVVKNVTGYDLPKLHVGALGTLGVLVEATFKVAPRPETTCALLFRLTRANSDTIAPLLTALLTRRVSPSLSLFHEADRQRHLFVTWSGPREVVDGECNAADVLCQELGISAPLLLDSAFTVAEPLPTDAHIRLRVSPSDAWRTHCAVAALGISETVQTLVPLGIIEVSCTGVGAARTLLNWASETTASISEVHAPLALRSEENIALWHPLPPAFPLMQRLKETLDPNGTLNPGRFVGGL
ncbi:MAG: FAD-binding oxidoreductase [Cytophagales bacterium]|nr:FAD-binding oxidoreductase [Armatimonadota bacterium]